MNDYIKFARKNGWVPDWAWYQMNGKSATENYMEQKEITLEKKKIIANIIIENGIDYDKTIKYIEFNDKYFIVWINNHWNKNLKCYLLVD